MFLAGVLLFFTLFVFTPYFNTGYKDVRKQEENKENYEKVLKEQKLLEEAIQRTYLMGKFDPAKRKDFAVVPAQYTITPNKIYLRKETLEAYLEMRDAALLDQIDLKIASATRNFDYQKMLWNNKWTGVTFVDGKDLSKNIRNGSERFEKILEYSAAPATSRHHWGTDIDLNAAIPEYFNAGKGKEEYDWLVKNASSFGFCQTYNLKDSSRPVGYNEEKWHWSYTPLSRYLTQKYKKLINNEDIKGFLGDEYAVEKNLINNYVLSINSECL